MINPNVILVDTHGKKVGTADRTEAHRGEGQLHQAFSIFIFKKLCHGDTTYLLLQKRSPQKLFGGLWTNTCCSHPLPNETVLEAASRRLKEEFGFDCPLTKCGSFIYKAHDTHGTEYEYDTVLIGHMLDEVPIKPDPTEINEWKWIDIQELKADLIKNPQRYTPWLAQSLQYASRHHS